MKQAVETLSLTNSTLVNEKVLLNETISELKSKIKINVEEINEKNKKINLINVQRMQLEKENKENVESKTLLLNDYNLERDQRHQLDKENEKYKITIVHYEQKKKENEKLKNDLKMEIQKLERELSTANARHEESQHVHQTLTDELNENTVHIATCKLESSVARNEKKNSYIFLFFTFVLFTLFFYFFLFFLNASE